MVSLVGCLDNSGPDDDRIITEPMARSYLNIANQSGSDLNVYFETTGEYAGWDSTVAVPADSATRIFAPGGSYQPPTPSESLSKISFYTQSGDTTTPRFTIEPLVDENWDKTEKYKPGDALTIYALTITKEDLH